MPSSKRSNQGNPRGKSPRKGSRSASSQRRSHDSREDSRQDSRDRPRRDARSQPRSRDGESPRNPQAALDQHGSPFAIELFGGKDSPQGRRYAQLLRELARWLEPYHKRELAASAMELSTALAQHRGSTVKRGYYDDEILVAAYCIHFMPWNVRRLILAWRASQPLSSQQGSPADGQHPTRLIEDWGAGPMVGLLAWWVMTGCEEPGLTYRAVERNSDILNAGHDLVKALGIHKLVKIDRVTEDIDLDQPPSYDDRADLLLVSQSFNEWLPVRGRSTEPIRRFARAALSRISKDGELFVMEPASRVVSWGVMELRNALRERSRRILAPCTHQGNCPLLDPRIKSWCHFRHAIELHPAHADLIRDFGLVELTKDSLSYSYLHAQNAHAEAEPSPAIKQAQAQAIELHDAQAISKLQQDDPKTREIPLKPVSPEKIKALSAGRVLSDPLKLASGMGVYVCGAEGRLQVDSAAKRWPRHVRFGLRQDQLVLYAYPKRAFRDPKSKAVRIRLADCVLPALNQEHLRELLHSRGDTNDPPASQARSSDQQKSPPRQDRGRRDSR